MCVCLLNVGISENRKDKLMMSCLGDDIAEGRGRREVERGGKRKGGERGGKRKGEKR